MAPGGVLLPINGSPRRCGRQLILLRNSATSQFARLSFDFWGGPGSGEARNIETMGKSAVDTVACARNYRFGRNRARGPPSPGSPLGLAPGIDDCHRHGSSHLDSQPAATRAKATNNVARVRMP